MAGTILLGSCSEPDIDEGLALQKNQQPSVTFPDALNFKNRSSSAGRMEDQLISTLNSTLFAESNYKVSEVHVCKLNTVNKVTTVETLDKQFESTLPSRWVTNDPRRNWNGDNDLNDLDWLPSHRLQSPTELLMLLLFIRPCIINGRRAVPVKH